MKEHLPAGSPLLESKYVTTFCKLIKEKAHFVNEFWSLGSYFFIAPQSYDADVLKKRWNEQSEKFMFALTDNYKAIDNFTAAEAENVFKQTGEQTGVAVGTVMQLLRVLLTGVGGGPMLFEMMELLGKKETLQRLETALVKVKS